MSVKSFLSSRSLKDHTNAFYTYSLTTNDIITSNIKTSSLYANTYITDSKYNNMMLIVKNGIITYSPDVPNKLIQLEHTSLSSENRILILEHTSLSSENRILTLENRILVLENIINHLVGIYN